MRQVKCIEKIRDKNKNIIKYRLIDKNKNITSVKSNELKESIRSGQIEVTNLTLTSDNRLVDKKSKQNNKTESLINRLRTLGYSIKKFNTDCGHECYIASSPDNTKHIFIIPDDVEYLYETHSYFGFITKKKLYKCMISIKGELRVVGGKGLISTYHIFDNCSAQYLDLNSFNTSNVTVMSYMFNSCKAKSIDLRSLDTSNVITMDSMFSGCKAQSIDLSTFNTSNVTNMCYMFDECEAQSLDLSSFDTSNVTNMTNMFSRCKAKSIDLRSFNTSNVYDMQWMFNRCMAQSLDLTSFNTSKVKNMEYMFILCKAQSIDLNSFNASNVTNMKNMFANCEAQIKVNDPKLKVQLQKDKEDGRL